MQAVAVFTVDVEDWYQSRVDYDALITERLMRNVERLPVASAGGFIGSSVRREGNLVSVDGRVRIRQEAAPQERGDFSDSICDGSRRDEPKARGHLFEADPVVTRVFILVDEADARTREAASQDLDEVQLAIVLRGRPDVEHLAGNGLARCPENERNGRGNVAHVDVGTPELLAEDDELTVERDLPREFVDGEVEPHARRGPVNGREAQAGAHRAVPIATQDVELAAHFRLRVEGNRPELVFLCRKRALAHLAVVAARRGKDEPLDTCLARVVNEPARPLDIDLFRELGLSRARWVSDDGREMDDPIHVAHRIRACLCVADVSIHELEVRPPPIRQQRGDRSMCQRVQDPDAGPLSEELVDEDRADVAGSPRHQDTLRRRQKKSPLCSLDCEPLNEFEPSASLLFSVLPE